MAKITITAMKWAPPFAAGQVRDHRARWVLNEVGWPYEVRLVDGPTLASAEYRSKQPYGQVPMMEEEGRPALFESGAIVIDVATRSGKLLPERTEDRSLALSWCIGALNSIEPFLMNVAEVDYFMQDEELKAKRRPGVVTMARKRLEQTQAALGEREWFVGDQFTIADLLVSSVLKIARGLKLLPEYPKLHAHQDRCFARPAYAKAIADQVRDIESHTMADMKIDPSMM